MAILVTDAGLSAMKSAENGGFRLNMTSFAVTEATNVELDIMDVTLEGTPVYRADIQLIEDVGPSTVRVTCVLPNGLPESGEWAITEIGLYLDSGILFAHGTFSVPVGKTSYFGIKFHVYVSAARLGECLNITISKEGSLPSTAAVRTLLDPRESHANAVSVLDQNINDDDTSSGSIAIKYGQSGIRWGFIGYSKLFTGRPDLVTSTSEFMTPVETKHGAWINDQEILLAQVITGAGEGQSRKVRFTKETNVFEVLEKPFTALNTDSQIAVWRHSSVSLPKRTADIPEYCVLGVGINTWEAVPEVTNPANSSLIPKRVSLSFPGTTLSSANLGTTISADSLETAAVFVNAKILNKSAFSLNTTTLNFFNPIEDVTSIEIVVFERVLGLGGSVYSYEATYDAENRSEFPLPLIPDLKDYVLVFLDKELVAPSRYELNTSNIRFSTPVTGKVVLLPFVNYLETGSRSSAFRHEFQGVAGKETYTVISEFVAKKNVWVFIDGEYLEQEKFSVSRNDINIKDLTPDNSVVVFNFTQGFDQLTNAQVVSGIDTGPVWVDPAGVVMQPNKIVPKQVYYVSNGSDTVYSMESNADKALVFAGGAFQDPSTIVVSAEDRTVTLPSPIPSGLSINVISFETKRDLQGSEVRCWRQSFTTEPGNLVYNLGPAEPDKTPLVSILYIGGAFIHSPVYTWENGKLTLTEQVPGGRSAEIWHFSTFPKIGACTQITFGSNVFDPSKTDYVHGRYDAIDVMSEEHIDNTLLFANTVYQPLSQYSINTASDYVFKIPTGPDVRGIVASTVVFHTGRSKTRLVLRSELARYVTFTDLQTMGGVGGTGIPGPMGPVGPTGPAGSGSGAGGVGPMGPTGPMGPPGADGADGSNSDPGGGDPEPGEGSGKDAKALFLNSSSQIFAVASDGSVGPPSIVFTALPQSIVGTVVWSTVFGSGTLTTTGNTATLLHTSMNTDELTVRARITENNVSYFDEVTVAKLYDGKDSINVMLTNESHTIGADVNGVVGSYAGANTSVKVFRGTVEETSSWSFTKTDSSGITSSLSGNTVTVTSMTRDTGYVDITAHKLGHASIPKRFSLSLSKTGVSGTNGSSGLNAITAMLDNESYTFAASATGVVTDFSLGESTIKILSGQNDDSANWSVSRVNSAGVTSNLVGKTVSITGFHTNNDTGAVTFTATRSGYPTLTKVFSLSKAKGTSGSGTAGPAGPDGKRGSMTFYIPNRTSWNDSAATTAAKYGGGVILNDTVVQYSTTSGFSQTRFWNGSSWVILTQVIDGNLLVNGSIGAEKISVRTITADSAILANAAVETLTIAGNAVTLAQAVSQSATSQISVDSTVIASSPYNGTSILSMIVTVSGTQPILVWASFSTPGSRLAASSSYDMYYAGQYWKMNTEFTECVAGFKLSGPKGTFTAGRTSSSVYPGITLTSNLAAVFNNVPAGTYTLSLMMAKAASSLPNYAARSATIAMLETKR